MEESIDRNARCNCKKKDNLEKNQKQNHMERENTLEDNKVLEKHDRKYNLLFYKIQETENETIIEKLNIL